MLFVFMELIVIRFRCLFMLLISLSLRMMLRFGWVFGRMLIVWLISVSWIKCGIFLISMVIVILRVLLLLMRFCFVSKWCLWCWGIFWLRCVLILWLRVLVCWLLCLIWEISGIFFWLCSLMLLWGIFIFFLLVSLWGMWWIGCWFFGRIRWGFFLRRIIVWILFWRLGGFWWVGWGVGMCLRWIVFRRWWWGLRRWMSCWRIGFVGCWMRILIIFGFWCLMSCGRLCLMN